MRANSIVSNSALPPEVTRLPDPLLPVEDIDPPLPGENPRGEVTDEGVADLRPSIREHGVLVPILIRRDGDRYRIVAGERRWRAAKLEGCATIPYRLLDVDSSVAAEIAIVENIQRKDMGPLQQAESYQRLVATRKSIDEIAARVGKSKQHVYRMLTLLRLIPKLQELVASDKLPVHYAFKLATVPAERQEDGLTICYKPLFRDEPSRDQLEPLANLTEWIAKSVRLDPHSEDTRMFLPGLAEQVEQIERVKRAPILAVSTLMHHTDRRDPKPILAKNWREIRDDGDRCVNTLPAVIVLGDRRGEYVNVCTAKRHCRTHWPKPESHVGKQPKTLGELKAQVAERERQEAMEITLKKETRWRDELRPRALELLAQHTVKMTWSRPLLAKVLERMTDDEEWLADLLGCGKTIPTNRYPQAVVVAAAIEESWSRSAFTEFLKALGIPLKLESLEAPARDAERTSVDAVQDKRATRSKSKRRAAA
jgi:ParB/RepB/Spo0J family partition protein